MRVSVYGGEDEPVADPAGESGCGRPRGGDVDRDRLVGLVVDRRVVGPVVLALEGDELLLEQPMDQGHRLAQAGKTLLLVGPLDADWLLVHRFAGADAEDDPPGGETAEGRECLGHDRGVVAEGRGQDAGAERDVVGRLGGRAQPHQRVGGVTPGVPPRLEVVARPDRFEPGPLRRDREVEQATGRELLGGSLVAVAHGIASQSRTRGGLSRSNMWTVSTKRTCLVW